MLIQLFNFYLPSGQIDMYFLFESFLLLFILSKFHVLSHVGNQTINHIVLKGHVFWEVITRDYCYHFDDFCDVSLHMFAGYLLLHLRY